MCIYDVHDKRWQLTDLYMVSRASLLGGGLDAAKQGQIMMCPTPGMDGFYDGMQSPFHGRCSAVSSFQITPINFISP